ncbi:hypothetical protein AMK16_06845 [Streptomyces sp. CB00455]|nr:hypothetical protein AMK16_06845 [Streptomyces sp. CB00455]
MLFPASAIADHAHPALPERVQASQLLGRAVDEAHMSGVSVQPREEQAGGFAAAFVLAAYPHQRPSPDGVRVRGGEPTPRCWTGDRGREDLATYGQLRM